MPLKAVITNQGHQGYHGHRGPHGHKGHYAHQGHINEVNANAYSVSQ